MTCQPGWPVSVRQSIIADFQMVNMLIQNVKDSDNKPIFPMTWRQLPSAGVRPRHRERGIIYSARRACYACGVIWQA
jgi:hypothetical protein